MTTQTTAAPAGPRPDAYRFPKAGINNGYHYADDLDGEEERFKHLWEPVYRQPDGTLAPIQPSV